MRIEIVQHQHDLVRLRKEIIDQVLHTMSKINLGSPFCHFDVTPTTQRLEEQKEIARAIAFVLVIKALWASRLGRQWTAFLSNQLNRMFVKTNLRSFRIVRRGIHVQNILHAPNKVAAYLGDAPLFLAPGLQLVFFSVRRTVSSDTGSSMTL